MMLSIAGSGSIPTSVMYGASPQNATTFFRTYLAHIEASCGKDLTLLNHQKVSLAENGAG
jgi:hypothetical protein